MNSERQPSSVSSCVSCGYDLAGLAVVDGQATCPECARHQHVAGHCEKCGYSLVGVAIIDGWIMCPECGLRNRSEGLVQRGRDADFVRRRQWLTWSPVIVLPATILSGWMPALGILTLLWCFAAPVLYVIVASITRVLGGQRSWPAVEVGAMWLVTSLLTTLVLFVIALVFGVWEFAL